MYELYARCAFGFEKIVAEELSSLGIKKIRPLSGGVAFFGTLLQAYQACLWSRVATRILLLVSRFEAHDAEELYQAALTVPWTDYMCTTTSFSIKARGTSEKLNNTQFTALKVKDALCDFFVKREGSRPSVEQKRPDVCIEVALRRDKASLYLDLSGEPLHRRGYREEGKQGAAPLKENLAAGILLKSGWKQGNILPLLYDPLCGSGTFVIEAAMIAADMAPGLIRDYWGFRGWEGHREDLWEECLEEAETRLEKGLKSMPFLIGSDQDNRVLTLAKTHARRSGLAHYIRFIQAPIEKSHETITQALATYPEKENTYPVEGMVVSNPPYGERLLDSSGLELLYAETRAGLATLPKSWSLHLITADDAIDIALKRAPYAEDSFYNGKIPVTLKQYRLSDVSTRTIEVVNPEQGKPFFVEVLEASTEQFVGRFKKVLKERKKWAKKQHVDAYRVYDADLPDYAVSIDLFEGISNSQHTRFICITEYRAPEEISIEKARRRLADICEVVPILTNVPSERVIMKVRESSKGGGQYGKSEQRAPILFVREADYVFELDLGSYLDTGLFLDHRLTRALIQEMSADVRFLNLFAYTGTASVYAAGGGAASTTTVDMSNTYLSWAQRNMERNKLMNDNQTFIRADVLNWVKNEETRGACYDLIYVDPPTFSNSKSMNGKTWSVQRDHGDLLKAIYPLLSHDGRIVFSCNLRKFKIDEDLLREVGFKIENISTQTIPHDFLRNKRIHHCFILTKA